MTTTAKELPIKGFNGYYVVGNFVWSRRTRVPVLLKGSRKDCITMIPTGGKKNEHKTFTRAKIVWCARNGVNPSDVPYEFAFKFDDDGVVVETFSDKMSEVRKRYPYEQTVREDYRIMLGFASLAIRVIDGDYGAEAEAYSFLGSYRKDLERYALGYVGREKAKDYADKAVDIAYKDVCKCKKAIANPIGMMKLIVRRLIKQGRKVIRTDFESRHVTKRFNLKTE